MSLYDSLMESVIYEDSIEEYKNRILSEGLFDKNKYISSKDIFKIINDSTPFITEVMKKFGVKASINFDNSHLSRGKRAPGIIIANFMTSDPKIKKYIDDNFDIKETYKKDADKFNIDYMFCTIIIDKDVTSFGVNFKENTIYR